MYTSARLRLYSSCFSPLLCSFSYSTLKIILKQLFASGSVNIGEYELIYFDMFWALRYLPICSLHFRRTFVESIFIRLTDAPAFPSTCVPAFLRSCRNSCVPEFNISKSSNTPFFKSGRSYEHLGYIWVGLVNMSEKTTS